MTAYTFLTVHRTSPDAMAAALADVVGVTAAEVDVSDDSDGHRDWSAAVLCHFTDLDGDLALAWDVYVSADVEPAPPTEAEAARRLAARLGTTVLRPADGVRPSAYRAALPDGTSTRARVLDGGTDGNTRPVLIVDAVGKPVGSLPGARVEPIREAGQDG
ncbi:hypothetical protein [Streptomyces sp. NPDC005752]|uniref:hypothetical protein n=1 Tax=Streptomyces sp. NPDC005752 TaxID=3157065 RepID=UPI0033E5E1B7